jgi:hypothetical protein
MEDEKNSCLEQEDERVKRERHNSSKYRKLYTDLLLQHQGLIQNARKHEHSDEARRIQSMIESEKKALLTGFCAGVALFASLRVMPRFLIRRFGSQEKMQALDNADKVAKEEGYYAYQRFFGESGPFFYSCKRDFARQS